MKLSERLQQRRFSSPAQESMLNIMVTSSWMLGQMAAEMSPYGITPAQYNVLRILRGSYPEKLTCSEIGARLIDRTPDVTRLLNRLQKAHLVGRERAQHDRRVVEVSITPEGMDVLEKLDPIVESATQRLTGSLSDTEHAQLSALLDRLRDSD